MTTTDTPRTDAYARHWPSETECVPSTIARQLERELNERYKAISEAEERAEKAEAEVERLKELLNRAISEIEKAPFHAPKLTAFTAHRLAERYREKMTNTSTKPIEYQEDGK
jgi:hypothetical protein